MSAATSRRRFLKTVAGVGAACVTHPWRSGTRQLPMPDLVVLLPGIMGSVLAKDGRDLWALSGSALANAFRTLGGSVSSLTLSGDDPNADDLGDGISAPRLIPDTHLIPGFWKIDGYTRISNFITSEFAARRGENYFEFPYDWRRHNAVAARRLQSLSRGWLDAWRRRSGNPNARLILVAHSMGGLIARHYLEVLGGWKDTRMLVTFGTPYRGSLNALDFLANGIKKKVGPFTIVDISTMARSFSSIYELLPTFRSYDPGTGQLVKVGETTGVPNVDARRAAAALKFHEDIIRAVESNAKTAQYMAQRYSLHPIVGNYQPTLQSGKRMGEGVQMLTVTSLAANQRGDGTVPEASARPVETAELEARHHPVFAADVHGSLQNFDPLLIHLRGLLKDVGANIPKATFRDGLWEVAIIIDDIYTTRERILLKAQCANPAEPLTATIVNVAKASQEIRAPLRRSGDFAEATLDALPEGTYRARVSGGSSVGSATDVFVVVAP